ncbi:MAG TPA: hypothetical protein VJ385_08850 [Fibrobacteria bacterium]|nr:hypothetical protein [Fibrobacteria bacterium]
MNLLFRRAAACLGLAAGLGICQSDPLISKHISRVIADEAGFWAFASDGLSFSRIDPFHEVLDIRNGSLPYKGGIGGGLGRASSALVFFGYGQSDSVTVGGLASLGRDGKAKADTLAFLRPGGKNEQVTLGVELSALALWHDTLIVGAGYGGIALSKAKPEGQDPVSGDSLIFRALPEGEDTAAAAIRCAVNAKCPVTAILTVAREIGFPDSVAALAVDSARDGVWLLIGTHTGLRRGLLSGNDFPKVSLPSAKPSSPIRIQSIHVDPGRNLLWVFSGSEYFFSDDHGLTFRKPPRIAGVASAPDSLTGFNPAPQAANIGDTTFVNFNLDDPGLVLFRKDSISANKGAGDFADVIYDEADGLPVQRGQGGLTNLAVAKQGEETALAVGSTFKGLLLRKTGGSNKGLWTNVNSLKQLKGGLGEVITFPTLFSGTAPDGGPEYVNLGYRLKKEGNVTITVYNYAMEKVKTIVKGSRRKGGGSRSEDPLQDRWDGKDSSGRHVSVGTYYILVESDKGEKGWGKAIAVHGRGP